MLFTLLVTFDACQFSVLVTSTHLSPQDTLSLVHNCSGHMLPLDNFNLPLYSTQEIFWYCRDCPGFELGTTGFVAWRSTIEPPQPLTLNFFCQLIFRERNLSPTFFLLHAYLFNHGGVKVQEEDHVGLEV